MPIRLLGDAGLRRRVWDLADQSGQPGNSLDLLGTREATALTTRAASAALLASVPRGVKAELYYSIDSPIDRLESGWNDAWPASTTQKRRPSGSARMT